MTKPKTQFPGYITPLLVYVAQVSPWSIFAKVTGADPKVRVRHAVLVEIYIAIWLVIVFLHLAVIGATYSEKGGYWAFLGLLPIVRIFEVVQANFVRHVVWGEQDVEQRGDPVSVTRTMVLALINYLEVALAFSVVYIALDRGGVGNLSSTAGCGRTAREAMYFSGVTQLTIGYGDYSPTSWSRVAALAQGAIGLVLTVFIFARFTSFFRDRSAAAGATQSAIRQIDHALQRVVECQDDLGPLVDVFFPLLRRVRMQLQLDALGRTSRLAVTCAEVLEAFQVALKAETSEVAIVSANAILEKLPLLNSSLPSSR